MGLSYDVGLRLPSDESIACTTQIKFGIEGNRAGYDTILTSETWGLEAFTRLGYLAAVTDAALGTSIIPVHSRSPALLAQSIATLAKLAARPVVLGIGLSSPAVVENWHGVSFEPALRRQREVLEIIQSILGGDPATYDGAIFDLDFDSIRFDPPESVSIYVGAQGETNVELTGEFADGWIPSYTPVSSLGRAREPLVRGARRRGRDPDKIDVVPSVTTCVLDDGEKARDHCRRTIAFYIGAMGEFHRNAVARHGYEDEATRVVDRWQAGEYDAARSAVTDELLDDIALAGTPSHARAWLSSRESDIDGLITVPSSEASPSEMRSTIEHVGAAVGRV